MLVSVVQSLSIALIHERMLQFSCFNVILQNAFTNEYVPPTTSQDGLSLSL